MVSESPDFEKASLGTRLIHAGEMEHERISPAVKPVYRATISKLNEEIDVLTKKYDKTEDPKTTFKDHASRKIWS